MIPKHIRRAFTDVFRQNFCNYWEFPPLLEKLISYVCEALSSIFVVLDKILSKHSECLSL